MVAERGVRALVSIVAACLLAACTTPATERTSDPRPTEIAALDDLRAADARWHRMPATITYRTERQRPGLPASAHQCLREFVDYREDIPDALRTCDPAGVVTLVWDPPKRWRIDVTEALTTTTAIVVGDRGVVCDSSTGAARTCRSQPVHEIVRTFPFHELIATTGATSRQVGIAAGGPTTVRERIVAGSSVRCFERLSGETSATWCFTPDGRLASLAIRTEGRGPTTAIAERVSGEIDAARFVGPLA
jgi:outer membrane biogenesis lipoprotein LolB